MLNRLDLDEAGIDAERVRDEWEIEFQKRFNGPLLMAAQLQQLMRMPPEAQAQFAQERPDEFEKLAAHIERMAASMGG